MLKRLSLSDDGAGTSDQSTSEQIEDGASESRMLRALEAMSQSAPARAQQGSAPLSLTPAAPGPRDQFGRDVRNFRPKTSQVHGPGRADPVSHAKPRHRFVKDGEVPVVHMAAAARSWEAGAAPSPRSDTDHTKLVQALEEQRQRADAAERARQDAVTQLRTLQTKAAHTEMALADATSLAEARLAEIAALQESLRSALLAVAKPVLVREPQPGDAPRKRGRPRKHPLPLTLPQEPQQARPVLPVSIAARPPALVPPPVVAPAPVKPAAVTPAPVQPAITRVDPPKRGRPRKIVPVAMPEPEPQPVEWWLTPAKPSVKRQQRTKRGR